MDSTGPPPPSGVSPERPAEADSALDLGYATLGALFDALPVGVALHGPRGELLFVNRAARALLGLDDGDTHGRTWLDTANCAWHADGTPYAPSDHPGPVALATRRPVRGVLMGFDCRPGSGRTWALVNAEPALAPDGSVRHVLFTLSEVTAQHQAEERLRESELRYRQLVEKAHDIIYRTDSRGRFTYVNPSASRLTGRSAAELLGTRALDRVRPDQRVRVRAALARQARERAPSTYDELVVCACDGRHVRVGQYVQLLADAHGVYGFQAVARELGVAARRAEPEALDATSPAVEPSARATRPRVLVVDDNDVNLKVTVMMLENLGYAAETATNGLEAVDACAREPYDVVLMDCQMPELDGFRATAFIRQREGLARRTPIVALTASALPSERQKCLAAGMDDFLCKPVGLRQLDEMLRRWTPREQTEASAARFVLPPDHPLRALETQGLGSLVAEVFGTFLETTPTYLREMRAAHGRGDAGQIVSLAHSLKGAAVQVGADDLAELCARAQAAARDDAEGVAALLAALESAFEGLRRTLEPQRERLARTKLP